MLPEENVWDYPRPPRLERVSGLVEAQAGGALLLSTTTAWRVLETSHPPTYYIPASDVATERLSPNRRRSLCEWKGQARYWDLATADGGSIPAMGWTYPDPTPAFADIQDCFAFYPGLLDQATVAGMPVSAQPGDFYGGWVTPNLRGPIKGAPGTLHW